MQKDIPNVPIDGSPPLPRTANQSRVFLALDSISELTSPNSFHAGSFHLLSPFYLLSMTIPFVIWSLALSNLLSP